MMLNWTSRLNIGLMILIMLSMRQQGQIRVFFCSNVGHLIRDCPEKKKETSVAAQNTNDTAGARSSGSVPVSKY